MLTPDRLDSFSVHDTYIGWVEALRELGQQVVTFNLDDRLTFYGSALRQVSEHEFRRALTAEQSYDLAINGLYSTLYQAWPDVLLVISGFFVPPRLLDKARRTRTRVVILHTESPYEDERQLKLAPYADVNLVDDPTNLAAFPNAVYMPKAYRPSIHYPGDPVDGLESDVCFVGTGYPSRIEFLEQVDWAGLDVILAGNWQGLAEGSPLRPFVGHDLEECLANPDTADLYRSSRIGFNLYRREAQRPELSAGWAMGPREIEMAACGLAFLRDPRGEGDEVLAMLPTFTTPDELGEKTRWWLDHPDEKAVLARKAREAIADRTFVNHAASLLRLLDN